MMKNMTNRQLIQHARDLYAGYTLVRDLFGPNNECVQQSLREYRGVVFSCQKRGIPLSMISPAEACERGNV